MTEEFSNTVNRLARARNFEDGAHCLITAFTSEDTFGIERKGINNGILNGIDYALEKCLEVLPDNIAREFREAIKQTLIEDEQRRFQRGTEE